MKTRSRHLTSAEVCRRTGLTYRRLTYWRERGFIQPIAQVYNRDDREGEGPGTRLVWSPDVIEEIRDLLERINDCPYDHAETQ